jgi:outer membrane protein
MNARLFATVAMFVAVPAAAQEQAPDTLGQAIADAYRSNPALEAQRAELRVLDEQVVQAGSPYRLNAGITMQLQYRSDERRALLGDLVTQQTRTMGAQVTASQILLNGGRTAAQVSAAEATVLAGRERLRQAENETLLEVVDSFVSVLRDQQLVVIQRRSLESYGRQVDQAMARERGGDLTRTDIAQARAQREIVQAQVAQAEANLQASRARFAAVVGRNPGTLLTPPTLPGLPASIDAAFAVAEKESPKLWQAILATKAGDARIAAQRAERAPVMSLTGGYGYGSPYSYNLRDAGPQATGGVTLSVPLLTGGVIDSRVRAAVAQRQQLGFEVETARREALANTQTAWNQMLAAGQQITSGVAATEAGEAALKGVQRGFAEGFRSNFEVLDSEQRLLNAQLVMTNATYTQYAAQARLLAVLGRLQAAAIDQGVPVYDPARNLKRVRGTFGPFDPVLAPIDRASMPSGRAAAAPVLPRATDTRIRPAATPMPTGALGDRLPGLPTLGLPTAAALDDAVVTG